MADAGRSISLRTLVSRLRLAPMKDPDWQECVAAFEARLDGLADDLDPPERLLYQRADGLLSVYETKFLPPRKTYFGLERFLTRLRELGRTELWVSVATTDTTSWAVYLPEGLQGVEAFVGVERPL